MTDHALELIRREMAESIAVKSRLDEAFFTQLAQLASRVCAALRAGGKVILFGNGGSAADAQHIAAELVGRFERERQALPAIALTTNTSILTALANDYDYERVFSRQVEAFVRPGDVVIGISTSGNSKNVLQGLLAARARGAFLAGLTGEGGGAMARACDLLLAVPSKNTARIQECHITCAHILCGLIEREMADAPA
jgi:D-sedoheptulose 7-phosphate isomerase